VTLQGKLDLYGEQKRCGKRSVHLETSMTEDVSVLNLLQNRITRAAAEYAVNSPPPLQPPLCMVMMHRRCLALYIEHRFTP